MHSSASRMRFEVFFLARFFPLCSVRGTSSVFSCFFCIVSIDFSRSLIELFLLFGQTGNFAIQPCQFSIAPVDTMLGYLEDVGSFIVADTWIRQDSLSTIVIVIAQD